MDALAAIAAFGALAKILPPLAALMSIVWIAMQMFRFLREEFAAKPKPPVDKS